MRIKPSVGDRVIFIDKDGEGDRALRRGDIGFVVEAEEAWGQHEGWLEVNRISDGYLCKTFSERWEVYVEPVVKATLEDAENLLAMVDQLEDSVAELAEAKQRVGEIELEVGILENKINELKNKLNIA